MLGAVVLLLTFMPWPNVDKSHITVLPAQLLLQMKAITTFYCKILHRASLIDDDA